MAHQIEEEVDVQTFDLVLHTDCVEELDHLVALQVLYSDTLDSTIANAQDPIFQTTLT